MRLTRLFVERPTLVFVFIALVTIFGTISLRSLTEQYFPNIAYPAVVVTVDYTGASPTEMRDEIVRPIEDSIAGSPDLDHIDTTIQSGRATISASFSLDSDQNTDLVNVQRAYQQAQRNLPNDLTPPSIRTFNQSESTVVTLVASSTSLRLNDLSAIVQNQIVPTMEQINGIANVNLGGTVTPAYEVEVDPADPQARGLTLNDVVNAISGNNVRAPGGIAYEPNRETQIDVRGDITSPQSVANLLIPKPSTTTGQSGSMTTAGSPNPWTSPTQLLRVGDVAQVVDSYEPQRSFATSHGHEAVSLQVQKTVTASEVTASQNVLAALPGLRTQYPQIEFDVLNVNAQYTQQQIHSVFGTLVEEITLTAVVMLFFLHSWRNAVVAMIAIPTSLLVTLTAMKFAHFTIDMISMLAMTLIIGILVDDSVVVLENIQRHYDQGEDPPRAAVRGRTEIGLAAIVITLVDVVVFFPIAFLPGIVGRFLSEFGLVVVIATLTSLFVSFTVTPALAGRWSLYSRWRPWPILEAFAQHFERARQWYAERVLPAGMRHAWLVVAIAAVTFVGSLALIPLGVVGFEFVPAVDMGQIYVQMQYPVGTPLATTTAGVVHLERLVDRIPDLQSEVATSGAYQAPFGGFALEGNVGQIQVFLKDNRAHPTSYWVSYLADAARRLEPHSATTVIPSTGIGGGNSQPIDEIVSARNGDPTPYAQQVYRTLARTPGAANVTSSASSLAPQLSVVFNREDARALNVSIGAASTVVRAGFGGALATQFETPSTGLEQVQVILPQRDQRDPRVLLQLPVRANNGAIVMVGDVASFVQSPAPPIITRENRQNIVHITANVAPGASLSNVQNAFQRQLAALHLPASVSVRPAAAGTQQNLRDTAVGMASALLLSSLLVYLLMVALYNSYISPFIIMFSVPVASVGALGALALTHQTLNLFSLIGTVLLIGLVTKNGILLVDYANTLRVRGLDRVAAIRESARVRFRPIIMTTISMIAGMTPLALGLERGAEVRRSLGIVVIGGLTSSLLLTLVLVPVVYVWLAPKRVPESNGRVHRKYRLIREVPVS
jgi:HAE1 family hydrophobic/amphiphilic exporter-1